MKNLIYYILLGSFLATSCDDGFLDRYPLDQQTEVTAFNTYDNFKTYSWNLYGYFEGFPVDGGYLPKNIEEEQYSDNLIYAFAGYQSPYAFQTKIEPSSGGNWDFSYIRSVNIMIDNIEESTMSESDQAHWRSVGYFFRALRYFDLVAEFGDVPWIEHVLTDDDELLYASRTPRDVVTDNILSNLQYAEEHIKQDGDGANTINQNVVRALISRFGLFEGSWRKYHQLGDANRYFEASFNASEKLMESNSSLMAEYDDIYNSEELVGKPGILLAKQYAEDLITHSIGRVARTAAWYTDMTRDAVESYLCIDGKPISTSPLYEGSESMNEEFRKRDRRLYYTVLPPYKVRLLGGATNSTTWEHTGATLDREFIDTMNVLSTATAKYLPVSNFAGYLAQGVPNFRQSHNGQAFIVSDLGFYFWKYYHRHSDNMALRTSTTDFPLFWMSEVLVNHAEAAFELGRFDQSVAEKTINRLRARGNVAKMTLSEIDGAFDTKRDADIDPILWEIRRERRIELMGDGFRFRDIKRWKKGNYLDKVPLGIKVNNVDYNNALTIYGGGSVGYVMQSIGAPKGWLDKYYLEPIPLDQFVLNPALEQNPGWRK